MDRNTIIGTLLIAIIMVVWMVWLSPEPPETPVLPDGVVSDSSSMEQQTVEDSAQAVEVPPPPVSATPIPTTPDSTVSGAQNGEERFIFVDSDLFLARFSTRGATLRSLKLKKYTHFESDKLVELVDTTNSGALALFFQTPASRNVDTRSFYFDADVSQDTLHIGDQPLSLNFVASVGDGSIRETFTFTPGSYEVDLRITQEHASSFMTTEGYELLWDGGIPFSEGDPENEANRSAAYGRSGGEVEGVDLQSDEYQELSLRGSVDWVATKNKYFAAVVIPTTGPTRGAEIVGEKVGDAESKTLWEDYEARLAMPVPAQPDEFKLYLGPIEVDKLSAYGLGIYDMVDYGWDFFEKVTRPLARYVFIPIFHFLATILPNYGIVIIIFSLLIKIVLYPLTKSSYKNMAKMRELQPQMQAIKEKYKDNPQKQQQATMKMYKQTGVNPLGGCLPMLLQYPILIALWQFLPQSIEIRQQGFLWATDLSAPDILAHLPVTIPFLGDHLSGFTLLMGISMVFQMRLQATPSTNALQTKMFTYIFPVMIFFIFNRLASGLNLYYLCYNVITAAQQKWINHTMDKQLEEEKAKGPLNSKGASQLKQGKGKKKLKAARSRK